MPQTPNRIFPDMSEDKKWALVNDNADKAVQDIGDLGARFYGTGSAPATVAANSLFTLSVAVIDIRNQYVSGTVQIVPRVEVFVDNNNNDNYLLGYGGSLSAEQQLALVSCWVARRPNTGNTAQFVVQLFNFGASSHTYYFVVDASYIASPPTGIFR